MNPTLATMTPSSPNNADDAESIANSNSSCDDHIEDEEHQQQSMKQNVKEEIAANEDRYVFWLRLLVIFVLIAAALCVSLSVYFYLDSEEQQEFQDQFDSDATKVLESIGTTLDNTLGPADALLVNLKAHAKFANETFPFVTLPSYGLQATKLLRASKALYTNINYVVQPEQKDKWQEYADQHKDYIDDALEIIEGDADWTGVVHKNYSTCYNIYTWGGIPINEPAETPMNYYIPRWHEFPIISGANGPNGGCPYNFDQLQLQDVINGVMYIQKSQKAVIGNFPTVNMDVNDPTQLKQLQIMESKTKLLLNGDEVEPHTQIGFPIFDDDLDSVYVDTMKPQKFVGYMALTIVMGRLIANALPENSKGIILVVDQSCGKPFTYRIDGPTYKYLGVGDLHEEKYDDMIRSEVWEEMVDSEKTGRKSSYTGIPISADFCPNTLKLYPSTDMENEHRSSKPVVLAIITAMIFLFTSIVFIFYDVIVARRQKIVKNRARESGAIVSSLFPEQVRQKLYDGNKQKQQNEEKAMNFRVQDSNTTGAETDQIANLHPETTIFFADLAGFTSWSSKRQPSEVFMLLETLYGAFDTIALRRHVFKVETIGDCYVAITGCPLPQKEHAVITVRFARDCMAKMAELIHELAATLGEDTIELGFRVGLHSGPVTAGVLRGQKARFQLFGDSVNTAARMESNGVKGKIHVSQATADALIASGKGYWLIKREEKIVAKGKGEMQTYFVNPNSTARTATSTTTSSRDDNEGTVRSDKLNQVNATLKEDNSPFGETEDWMLADGKVEI